MFFFSFDKVKYSSSVVIFPFKLIRSQKVIVVQEEKFEIETEHCFHCVCVGVCGWEGVCGCVWVKSQLHQVPDVTGIKVRD